MSYLGASGKKITMHKAITFRASSIGDGLMGKYFLENIHAVYPNAQYAVVIGSRAAMIEDLFRAYPWLTVVEANRRTPQNIFRLFRKWRNADVTLTQYSGKPGGVFGFASKCVARTLSPRGTLIGFVDESPFNRYLYDLLISFDLHTAPAELEKEALRRLSVPISFPLPTLAFIENKNILERFIVTKGEYIVVHLFAGNSSRGLSPQNQKNLLKALHNQFPHTVLLISGGKEDRKGAERATQDIPNAQVIAGETTLQEMMNLISCSSGVVCVDTGMAHIAAQLKIPLVVLATCLGLHWWGDDQYGTQLKKKVFSCDSLCKNGHKTQIFPLCINQINFEAVAIDAKLLFDAENEPSLKE
jgi:ADP-heptose:LPS heptosyltransferase